LLGLIWWLTIGILFYMAIALGYPAFPNIFNYFVLAFFEGYSCYRCGQDAKVMHSLSGRPERSPVAYASAPGDG
jgi:hypothetical protein